MGKSTEKRVLKEMWSFKKEQSLIIPGIDCKQSLLDFLLWNCNKVKKKQKQLYQYRGTLEAKKT